MGEERKKNSKYSGPSKLSGDENMILRSSIIGPGVSTTTLVAYAEKKHKFFSKELNNEEKQVLATLQKDLKKVCDLVIKYGKLDSDKIAYIDLKLFNLAKVFDKKLNHFMLGMQKERYCQRLVSCNGMVLICNTKASRSR